MSNYDASIRVHTEVDNAEIKRAEKEVEQYTKKLDNVRKRSAKLEALGGTEKQFEALGYDAEMLESQLADATTRLERLKAVQAPQDVASGFKKAEQSAKKCFKAVDDGAKKSNKGLNSTMKVLKNIVLSMVAFQVMFKGAEYIAEGFKNLVQYSSELNGVFSDLKSETATLKNSLATAFAPIVLQIIPHLTNLVSWLNTAMNAITQFWAVLSGKSTYTRAKKQIVDYAKSLQDASKTAKGALAAFDEINVLNKSESTGAGGEVSGADAFEEVEVDKDKFTWVEWLKANLNTIKDIVGMIGVGFLAWKIAGGFTSNFSTLLGVAVAAAGVFMFAKSAVDALQNGVDWENLNGMLGGAATLIVGLGVAFGTTAAVIGAVVSGLAMIAVGIYDITQNCVNLQNALLIIAGTFMTVAAIAGGVVGGIAALVAGLVLAIAADWEDFKAMVWEPMKEWGATLYGNFSQMIDGITGLLDGLQKFVTGVFTGNWKLAWEGIKEIFKGAIDFMDGLSKGFQNLQIGLLNTLINGIAGAYNAVIDAINSIDFTVPDWVPVIGGKQFGGFNLPRWEAPPNLPYLETGAIATSATLAVFGENGDEAVLPLENHTEWMDVLADKINSSRGPVIIKFTGSLAELGRVLKPVIDNEDSRIGNNYAVR